MSLAGTDGSAPGVDPRPSSPAAAMAADYERAAGWWRRGPDPIYRRFARILVGAAPIPLAGLRVLDLGAGTGAVSVALRGAGARPVAVDSSPAMARWARRCVGNLDVAVADALHLPAPDGAFDGWFAGFVLNHLPAPWRALGEAARVTRPGGVICATTFMAGGPNPVTRAVERIATDWGWRPPAWYEEQRTWAALTDTPGGLAAQAATAGLGPARVSVVEVDAGTRSVEELVAWRLGHAHMAGLAGRLSAGAHRTLVAATAAAVGPDPQPLRRSVLVLSIHRPA
ncbi:MAG TPA: class I SAM-dependent methyltransferase [Acidimicrobiales bacterium]|nr:class I SAM-dependent methyltransferase [Acidimicrobiales bacterium]